MRKAVFKPGGMEMIGAALLLFVCTACGPDSSTNASSADVSRQRISATGDDPVILVHSGGNIGAVGITGEISYHAMSKCLTFRVGSDIHLPIWPPGTQPVISKGRHGVRVKDTGLVVEGEKVMVGGHAADEQMLLSDEAVRRCADIPGRRQFIIVGQIVKEGS